MRYDDENRLVSAQVTGSWKTDFVYDGLGRLRSRAENSWTGSSRYPNGTTYYLYDGMRVIQERTTAPTPSYTRGIDLSENLEGAGGIGGLLARSHGYGSSNRNWYTHNCYHADGNGNITYLVNPSQTLAASTDTIPRGTRSVPAAVWPVRMCVAFRARSITPPSNRCYAASWPTA